jgi:hypothetical protein
MALQDELRNSVQLIQIGLDSYGNIIESNNFYQAPFFILSIGLERFLKSYICYGHYEKLNAFPTVKEFKSYSHKLDKMLKIILDNYFSTNCAALEKDQKFIKTHKHLRKILELLTGFAVGARYYNFDIIAGDEKTNTKDIEQDWAILESKIISESQYNLNSPEKFTEVKAHVVEYITKTLYKFLRALARQFTLGKLGALARKHSGIIHPFLFPSENLKID